MAFEPNELLRNVAAIREQSRFLQNALRFELGTNEILDSAIQLLRVGAERRLATLFDFLSGPLDAPHPLAKVPFRVSTFLLPHFIQSSQGIFELCQNRLFQEGIGGRSRQFESAGKAQNKVEIRLRRQPELLGHRAKGLDIAAQPFPIEAKTLSGFGFEIE